MGKITTSIDYETGLTIQKVIGQISAAEIKSTIDNYYKGKFTALILWDFSDAIMNLITPGDARGIALLTKKYAEIRPNGKTAMVFSSDLGFGLGRVYDSSQHIENPGVSYMSFRNFDDAQNWLMSG